MKVLLVGFLVAIVTGCSPASQEHLESDGVYYIDSLVCTDSSCRMSIRNDVNKRLEVVLSREKVDFVTRSSQ